MKKVLVILPNMCFSFFFLPSGKDLIPTFATFVSCLSLGVELGILLGVGINIILLLIPSARPFLHYEKTKVSRS